MRILSEKSYRRLIERNRVLASRCQSVERSYQELVLLLGLKGFTVDLKPEVPAKPAALFLKTLR
jgi:hypothetical protein